METLNVHALNVYIMIYSQIDCFVGPLDRRRLLPPSFSLTTDQCKLSLVIYFRRPVSLSFKVTLTL